MWGDFFVCPVCNNKDPIFLAYKGNKIYCRKCILLNRAKLAENKTFINKELIKANLKYPLTKTQQIASNSILNYVKNNQSVIVNAVCGAGKTELCYASIEYFLNQNKKVAFTIPRKDVCIEIYNRLKKDYPNISMCLVYGGHNDIIEAQLTILTTHQLFRYKNYFDLLILDEADAFPYYNNDLLSTFLHQSVIGPIIYLSATIMESYKKECQNVVFVNKRFHNQDLPIPQIIKYNVFNKYLILNNTLASIGSKPTLIFVPTIEIGMLVSNKIKIPFIYSSCKDKQEKIKDFQKGNIKRLITTSILERGMTFSNVQVIVFEANHNLFDMASLIQISGRVGRKLPYTNGKIYFLCSQVSEDIKKCIKEIKSKNKMSV